ncbi:MAG: glycosyltransferase [Chitinophagaceae bacterium]|nr:glycosyltransferase [Chitinophagaceae bacterium]
MEKNRKKIVLVGPAYPYRGGQALDEAHIYNALTNAGMDIETISFKVLYPNFLFPGTTQFDNSKTAFYPHQEKIHRIINSINPFTWYKAYKKIKSLNADLVLFVWWMPFFGPCYGTINWFLKKYTKTKVAYLVENFVSHEKRFFDLMLTKFTLNQADAFVTLSGHIKERIEEILKPKPTFQTTLPIYDFYDLKNYTKESAKDFLNIKEKNVILFFGLIRHYKGLDRLIAAMPSILKSNPDTLLLIAGECYEDIEVYKKIITKLNIESHCKLIDKFISNEDVEPYFKAADTVCLPYYHGTQSGILMMAYGFKKPVVVTNVGGVAELVIENKTGKIIEDNEPQKISSAISSFIENNENINFESNIENLASTLGHKNFDTIIFELAN